MRGWAILKVISMSSAQVGTGFQCFSDVSFTIMLIMLQLFRRKEKRERR